jgi:hypothetical protein
MSKKELLNMDKTGVWKEAFLNHDAAYATAGELKRKAV